MLVSYFESLRYVGHLFPLAFLRVYLGTYYLSEASDLFHGDFVERPKLAELIKTGLSSGTFPIWYEEFLKNIAMPHWKIFAFLVVGTQALVGFSYLLGFCVRPMALIGAISSLHFMIMVKGTGSSLFTVLTMIHLMMAWVGGGRCLGFDYYFYKRHRGIWW